MFPLSFILSLMNECYSGLFPYKTMLRLAFILSLINENKNKCKIIFIF